MCASNRWHTTVQEVVQDLFAKLEGNPKQARLCALQSVVHLGLIEDFAEQDRFFVDWFARGKEKKGMNCCYWK